MQLFEQIKRSVNRCFNSVELPVVLKSNELFPPNLKHSGTAFQRSYLFICFYGVCYVGRTTQWLEIKTNQQIPSNIRKHTSDYTAAPNSQNSTSAIGRHQLSKKACARTYSSTMFPFLKASTNVLQLFILKALLIMKRKPEFCIQKQL